MTESTKLYVHQKIGGWWTLIDQGPMAELIERHPMLSAAELAFDNSPIIVIGTGDLLVSDQIVDLSHPDYRSNA